MYSGLYTLRFRMTHIQTHTRYIINTHNLYCNKHVPEKVASRVHTNQHLSKVTRGSDLPTFYFALRGLSSNLGKLFTTRLAF